MDKIGRWKDAAVAVVEFTVDCLTAFRLQLSPAQAQPSFVLGGCASLGLPQRTHSVEAGHCLLIDKGAPLGSSIVLDCGWRNVSTGIAHLIVSRSYRYWCAIDLRRGSGLPFVGQASPLWRGCCKDQGAAFLWTCQLTIGNVRNMGTASPTDTDVVAPADRWQRFHDDAGTPGWRLPRTGERFFERTGRASPS